MQPIERRIATLETKARGDGSFKVVLMHADETERQALQRHGIPDDTRDVVFIVRFGPMTAVYENKMKNPL